MYKTELSYRRTVVILLIIIVCILSYGLIRQIVGDFGKAAAYRDITSIQQDK